MAIHAAVKSSLDEKSPAACSSGILPGSNDSPIMIAGMFLPHRKVYQAVQASLTANRPLRGALFWEWTFPGNARGNRGVETNDSTFRSCGMLLSRSH